MLKCILIAACLVLMPCQAVAGPYEDGKAAHSRKDYATALRLWVPLAEQGYANSQVMLGAMYEAGHGVPKDRTEALKWYRKAAEQGHVRDDEERQLIAEAQGSLGLSFEHGRSVPKDYVLAYMWYNIAAAHDIKTDFLFARFRDELAEHMTDNQVAEAQKLSRELRAKQTQ